MRRRKWRYFGRLEKNPIACLLLYVETTAHTQYTQTATALLKFIAKPFLFFEKAKKEGIEEEEEKKRKMEGKKKKK